MSGFDAPDPVEAPHDIVRLTDRLFRDEAGKLVAVLTRMFGIDRLQLAEDVVQEAMARAMQTWPYYGIPSNPAAWLTQTAKNLALDVVRRDKRFHEKQTGIAETFGAWVSEPAADEGIFFDDEIKDGRLRLMFACCHPVIPQDARVALALKTLCGFGVPEIARAFLSNDAAIAKRLTRARQKIKESGVPFEIPTGDELTERLESVEQTLYLLFNEGYKASTGDHLIREDLCREAILLASMLVDHPSGDRPRTRALLALMLLSAARLPARVDTDGNMLRLRDQDRSVWDRTLIARGMRELARASQGDEISEYHIQAAIAACHCSAPTYESTDWPRILALYDKWTEIDQSPVIHLNRAVAVANVHGAQAGLKALDGIPNQDKLAMYYLLFAVKAEFEADLGQYTRAAEDLRSAIRLTEMKSEQAFLESRLQECEAQLAQPR